MRRAKNPLDDDSPHGGIKRIPDWRVLEGYFANPP